MGKFVIAIKRLWMGSERQTCNKNYLQVIHDYRPSAASLMRQYQLRLRGVFDTQVTDTALHSFHVFMSSFALQAAFCVLMIEQRLPPRLINLRDLYYKCGDRALRMSVEIEVGECMTRPPYNALL
jgi:hypothetical protein